MTKTNTQKKAESKKADYKACARMSRNKGPDLSIKGCLKCQETYPNRFADCKALIKTKADTKKASAKPKMVKGRFGYRKDSYTDVFCETIYNEPILMSQTLPSDKNFIKGSNGPHPRCYKRLFELGIADKLPTGHIYLLYDVKFDDKGRLMPVKSKRAPSYKKAMTILSEYKKIEALKKQAEKGKKVNTKA